MALSSSTAAAQHSSWTMKGPPSTYHPYPPSVAKYEQVIADPNLFRSTLEELHFSMGTKFMNPIIGGKELDLHRLFVEVTSRGGIEKVIKEKRWKEVTAVFNFPSTATNASFVLRKYYTSLLLHFEQIYYFKAQGWIPGSTVALEAPHVASTQAHFPVEPGFASPEGQLPMIQQHGIKVAEYLPRANSLPSECSSVIGVIDGKFENGYLVTVSLGSEKLKGILYHAPYNGASPGSQNVRTVTKNDKRILGSDGLTHRRRRKKSEIKRRDPAHPKPNRSGYNFFFAEQHARLKPLHPGKDREISKMIGELWNKLEGSDKEVYQEKAYRDKERYRLEMQDYRARLKMGQVISHAVPIQPQQGPPMQDIEIEAADNSHITQEGDSSHASKYESRSISRSSKSTDTNDNKLVEGDSDMETSSDTGPSGDNYGNEGLGMSVEEQMFELRNQKIKVEGEPKAEVVPKDEQ